MSLKSIAAVGTMAVGAVYCAVAIVRLLGEVL